MKGAARGWRWQPGGGQHLAGCPASSRAEVGNRGKARDPGPSSPEGRKDFLPASRLAHHLPASPTRATRPQAGWCSLAWSRAPGPEPALPLGRTHRARTLGFSIHSSVGRDECTPLVSDGCGRLNTKLSVGTSSSKPLRNCYFLMYRGARQAWESEAQQGGNHPVVLQEKEPFSSVAQSSPTLPPHEPQPARPPCPSPTPGVHSNSPPPSW